MARRRIVLKRRNVVARILKDRGDALLITGLGSPTWDAAAAGDDAANFYLWGGMGGAALIGLGLAMAARSTPCPVADSCMPVSP